jgi:hypothetical protein
MIVRLKYLAATVVGGAIVFFLYSMVWFGWPIEPLAYIPAPVVMVLVFVGVGALTIRSLAWLEREYLEPWEQARKRAGADREQPSNYTQERSGVERGPPPGAQDMVRPAPAITAVAGRSVKR